MTTIKIKGHEFAVAAAKGSFDRRALQYKNKIIAALGMIGLSEDDMEIELKAAFKSAPASWYLNRNYLHYSYKSARKYVENLYVVLKVIELEVDALLAGRKTPEEFISEFSEERDVEHRRRAAREILGVDADSIDLQHIDSKYKELAKKHHPDMPDGNTEKFKQINHAHKVLRRELQ
ncbi:MAG: DnaJ domain-containing protein [Nanoarchaeota archaeon]